MTTPETYDTLRGRIKGRYDDLSPHLQRLARTALDEPNLMALQTISSIAERTGVQPSTIIRFAKEFGYDGFSSMQQVFKLRLIEGGPDYREQVYVDRAAAPDTGNSGTTLDRCVDALIASLERLKRDVEPGSLKRAVDLCGSARHIYVAGLRRSRPIATYFAYGMIRLERHCSVLDFSGGMATQQVANMSHRDLLVAIAFTEYAQPVVDVVRDAHLRGIRTLTITDAPSSPLARDATLTFYVDTEASGEFRPISGAIGLVQSIIVSLGATL